MPQSSTFFSSRLITAASNIEIRDHFSRDLRHQAVDSVEVLFRSSFLIASFCDREVSYYHSRRCSRSIADIFLLDVFDPCRVLSAQCPIPFNFLAINKIYAHHLQQFLHLPVHSVHNTLQSISETRPGIQMSERLYDKDLFTQRRAMTVLISQ